MNLDRVIHVDCRHYRSDRPCRPHKQSGVRCADCPHYDRIATRILIVKLDAMGDVLRTTALLQPLKRAFPASHVTWLTRPESVQLLANVSLIDRVLPLDAEALAYLQTEPLDVVVNPDAAESALRLAALARAKERRGFTLDEAGRIKPLNAAARTWYVMGQDDALKKANTRTYQAILTEICGLDGPPGEIQWQVSDSERQVALAFGSRHGLGDGPRIGLFTGAGGRWRWKRWTDEGFAGLITALAKARPDARVLLLGGPSERDTNARLKAIDARVVDTGCDNSLREFGALVELCDVVLTGDTLAMHVATALGKRVVALFGPTSASEIELYGRGVKIVPAGMDCLGCYLSDCDVRPACMQRIGVDTVLAAVLNELDCVSATRAVA